MTRTDDGQDALLVTDAGGGEGSRAPEGERSREAASRPAFCLWFRCALPRRSLGARRRGAHRRWRDAALGHGGVSLRVRPPARARGQMFPRRGLPGRRRVPRRSLSPRRWSSRRRDALRGARRHQLRRRRNCIRDAHPPRSPALSRARRRRQQPARSASAISGDPMMTGASLRLSLERRAGDCAEVRSRIRCGSCPSCPHPQSSYTSRPR
jgi:hypothetical protein